MELHIPGFTLLQLITRSNVFATTGLVWNGQSADNLIIHTPA